MTIASNKASKIKATRANKIKDKNYATMISYENYSSLNLEEKLPEISSKLISLVHYINTSKSQL
jgi:hypothetical protein